MQEDRSSILPNGFRLRTRTFFQAIGFGYNPLQKSVEQKDEHPEFHSEQKDCLDNDDKWL